MDIYKILSSIDHDKHNLIRYITFINSCKTKNLSLNENSYLESHHICPKSLFPEYKSLKKFEWNKVLLTPRQHFIAHLILSKALPSKDMRSAIYFMSHIKRYDFNIKTNSKLYSEIKLDNYSKKKSKITKNKMSKSRSGKVSCKDKDGNFHLVEKEIFEQNKNLVGVNKGNSFESKKGLSRPNFKGRSHSKESKLKTSKSIKIAWERVSILQCTHCGKSGKQNMKRYHFDNCKSQFHDISSP